MGEAVRPNSWLTARRLRNHALILGVAVWSIYVWTLAVPGLRDRNGNLKGTDFLHFYALAWETREHRGADLYNLDAQAKLAAQHVPEAAGIRYLPLYPPQLSLVLEPLSHLSYASALAFWWAASVLIYAICCFSLWRACSNLRGNGWTVFLIALAFPPFFHLIAWGQTSAVALACFTLIFFCLRDKREFLTGVVLGCLIFKPQLGLAAALVFLASGRWTIVVGAITSAALQLSVGALYYGFGSYRAWLHMMTNAPLVLPWFEPRVYQTHCLRTFWSMLVPWHHVSIVLYFLSAIVVLASTVAIWKRAIPLSQRYSALLLATVLVAPHLTVYDLVILAPSVLLLANDLVGDQMARQPMGTILYLVYFLPLVGPLARWTHVQLSAVAMAVLLYLIWRVRPERTEAPLQIEATAATQNA